MNCRFCRYPLSHTFCDLGQTPLSNSYISPEKSKVQEAVYPLHAFVCEKCFLVQVGQFEKPEAIFGDYAYFSSYSDSWLEHAKQYTQEMMVRFGLNEQSQVVEIASNDGYLLQYFLAKKIPVLGIEPAKNVALVAQSKGIPTIAEFFCAQFAKARNLKADLIIANNVLAHVPDLNDFVEGIGIALASGGVATIEFPHLLKLIEGNQFDTIYHEHFSYFSLHTLEIVFEHHGLRIFDVDSIATHGGSLRIYVCHQADVLKPTQANVIQVRDQEKTAGLLNLNSYFAFDQQVRTIKSKLLKLLQDLKQKEKKIAAYGAPAKGNTLLNYCGITVDLLPFTVDRSPHKQGKLLPGSRIPIASPETIRKEKPDYILILPWNLQEEIMAQLSFVAEWGGQWVIPIPEPRIIRVNNSI